MISDLHDFVMELILKADVFTPLERKETEFPKREDRLPYPSDSSSFKVRKLDDKTLQRQRAAAEKEFWDTI